MPEIPDAVTTLERELRRIFGSRLQSLVVYGLGTHVKKVGEHHEANHRRENLLTHTLAIVETLTTDDLRACTGRVGAWHEAGLATPLILAAHEFGRSLDAFPFEFGGILSDHVLVSGSNPFDGLNVAAADLRRACEVAARSHLLHLREGYLETRGRGDALAVLIVRSAASFATLVTSIARLEGHASDDVAAAARRVEHALALPGATASDIVALVGVDEIPSADAERLFQPYLDAVERLVKHVDAWTRA